jgi:phosphocarrier protein
VSLTSNGRNVNGKSLMGVMMLAASKGSHIVLETDGADETEALDGFLGRALTRGSEGCVVAAARRVSLRTQVRSAAYGR